MNDCRHEWVGGMCVVSEWDADSVNAERLEKNLPPLECSDCETKYDTDKHSPYN